MHFGFVKRIDDRYKPVVNNDRQRWNIAVRYNRDFIHLLQPRQDLQGPRDVVDLVSRIDVNANFRAHRSSLLPAGFGSAPLLDPRSAAPDPTPPHSTPDK